MTPGHAPVPILQKNLPHPPWEDAVRWRLPGLQPIEPDDWLIRDDAFADQMAYRDDLISHRFTEVHDLLPTAVAAAGECYDLIVETLNHDPDYTFKNGTVIRPDGVSVVLLPDKPLLTLGRLIQADLCLMQPGPQGHVLAGAILCFPAHWTLAEKLGRPMPAIHTPVAEYDEDLARRVQRIFDAMRPEQILGRSNAILYRDAELFAPKPEAMPDSSAAIDDARFVRSERQALRKLPISGAIVFSIHTYMVATGTLKPAARATLNRLVR